MRLSRRRLDFSEMADLRIAILDSDSGFVRVLVKRAGKWLLLAVQNVNIEPPK